jgi:hypothetical protein
METSTKVGDWKNQPMLTCVVYTTSHREAIKLRKKLSNILEEITNERLYESMEKCKPENSRFH